MLSALLMVAVSAQPSPVAHFQRVVRGKKLEIIQADLQNPEITATVELASGWPGTDQPFGDFLRKPGTLAAVNGAYFDKNTKKPIGDIWVNGRLQNFGAMGAALCLGPKGEIDIRRVVRHKRVDWSDYETVLACGPTLMQDGEVDVDWQGEGFRDPAVTGSAPRMGVGYNKAGKLMMVYCPRSVTFEEFAEVMRDLGCHEAMNLDAGASLAMWHKGKTIRSAGRRLTNVLVIRKR